MPDRHYALGTSRRRRLCVNGGLSALMLGAGLASPGEPVSSLGAFR
jgi:hypothetical protein